MAAAAVKLPLAVKKALRDAEADNKAECALMEKAVGFPVTFNWNVEAAWTALTGSSSQENLPSAATTYLKSAREGMERECKDDLNKAELVRLWTTKNVTFTVEPESFVGADYVKTNVGSWNGYNGIRIVNGDFDIFTKFDRFWANTDNVWQEKYENTFSNATEAGKLSLLVRKELRDEEPRIKAVKERLAKALGLDAVQWNIVADGLAISARKDLRDDYKFSAYLAISYMEALATCLERQAADDMVKEAVVDAFGKKTVSLKVYDSMDGVKGLETHSSYNGIQFLDGEIIVFTPPNNWACNIDQVGYEHDIVKLF